MIYNRQNAVGSLKPNGSWSWHGFDYANLKWDEINTDTKPTESEIDAEVTRLNNAEPMRLLRVERDRRLSACDWVSAKATDTGVAVTTAWKTYRQALRDLPASASPSLDSYGYLDMTSVTWPTEPS